MGPLPLVATPCRLASICSRATRTRMMLTKSRLVVLAPRSRPSKSFDWVNRSPSEAPSGRGEYVRDPEGQHLACAGAEGKPGNQDQAAEDHGAVPEAQAEGLGRQIAG